MAKDTELHRATHHNEEYVYLHEDFRDDEAKVRLNGQSHLMAHALLRAIFDPQNNSTPKELRDEWENLCQAQRSQSQKKIERTLGKSPFFQSINAHIWKVRHYNPHGPLTTDIYMAASDKKNALSRYAQSQPRGKIFSFKVQSPNLIQIRKLPAFRRAFSNVDDGVVHLSYFREAVNGVTYA
ncbi:MAG: hypothetical protein A2600_09840 [Candidatus Lambdaproteobacteria bacterium RIFOXYD1_FULL_56_27]|uniref:Uncharacterized protein n=1 Tax=Candidatus Lambdaproteobacteria bacterium RIFOXYD2_FULL_56_26 TaxID=1817773 RepID=A0A1F6GMF5_9PROT|nr:MAG: hypothetical protein A2557_02005 [Candidatus Lambdaproteobacteria bacterium RIFOXYD2_FULL_56_26]OGH03305.1 MAG: hypothetical protein A2426_07125 [Candidatus Lambdaproteobacteria bacterium RIFOXYC1_FULL_56_13]OGH09612.1 MAG: hypothetical protein A2600_09840 [Candidatus Lambdaproteobacteria bacterium RIFOXYD1_FULL_56_27]